ncbi:MAG: G-D-S-L family lipolytic protein [Saprospirales bacterium]|nr:G-D-S-L family lipolytic protein [Saprospirales bacterium]MBK8922169.1 G-D-S-L family lipolytic protein [Saprospirales bacterium]
MKRLTLSLIAIAGMLQLWSFMPKPTRIIFFGDSITEAAVQAGGYISQLRDSLPPDAYELTGAGISGNKVYDLYLRLDDDVLAKQPDRVFVFVGVNDVWHKRLLGTGTDADKFERFYTALIKKMQAQGIRVTLCTPAVIGEKTDCTNPLDGELNQYAQIIRRLAAQMNCGLCDLRQAFLTCNQAQNPQNREKGILTTDGVHLNAAGNTLVAQQMLIEIRR